MTLLQQHTYNGWFGLTALSRAMCWVGSRRDITKGAWKMAFKRERQAAPALNRENALHCIKGEVGSIFGCRFIFSGSQS